MSLRARCNLNITLSQPPLQKNDKKIKPIFWTSWSSLNINDNRLIIIDHLRISSISMIIWMLRNCVLMHDLVLYYRLDYQQNEGGARITHNGPFHGQRLHVCINTQKSLKRVSEYSSCFSFHTPPLKHFWNLFPTPNLMAREHKGWKQNLQSIPKLECGTLSCVSWNR